jgi:hypothetical protein
MTSLLLWPRLTWSFGCTFSADAREARFAITSLAFMLVLVPLPVWNTSIGNSRVSRAGSDLVRRGFDRSRAIGVEQAERAGSRAPPPPSRCRARE